MLLDELLSRTHEWAIDERALIKTAFGIVDTVQQKAASIRSNRELSQVGIQAKLVEVVIADPWTHLGQLRDQAGKMGADIVNARLRLIPKRPDPGDVVRAMDLGEMRRTLLAMKRSDRLRLAQSDDAFAEAALLAHPALSGLSAKPVADGQPSEMDMVRTAYQERNFAQQVAGIALREKTMEAVNSALRNAAERICAEAGIVELEVGRLISKETATEVDPENLPKITRADLNTWSTTDPGRAAAEMKKVYDGKAVLVD